MRVHINFLKNRAIANVGDETFQQPSQNWRKE